MQRRRRRDRHLRRLPRMRGDELEMLDHRVAGEVAELARHPGHHLRRLHAALEVDLALVRHHLDPRQGREKVGLPRLAAEFAVGDRLQPDRLLLRDQCRNLLVLDLFQAFGRDRISRTVGACLLQRGGTQQAADMVGAKWRGRAWGHARGSQVFLLFPRTGRDKWLSAPIPRPPIRRSCAASPTAPPRRAHCPPRSRRSRIAAKDKAARAARIWSPRRCGA